MGRSNEPKVHRCYFAGRHRTGVRTGSKSECAEGEQGDAQKVVTIISGDKAKTQTYCEIMKLGEQIGQAYEKNDKKMVAELSQKFETLEKALGPEYAALLDGLQYIDPQNHQLHAEFLSAFGALARLCTR